MVNEIAKDFIIEEYRKTCDIYVELMKQISITVKQSYAYSAGLISILGFFSKTSYNNPLFELILSSAIPLTGIFISLQAINSQFNFRRREVWLYNRMNYLRNISLFEEKDIIPIKLYLGSKQGKITESSVNFDWAKFKRSESFFNINVLIGFISLWSMIILQVLIYSYKIQILNFASYYRWSPLLLFCVIFFIVKTIIHAKCRTYIPKIKHKKHH